MRRSRSTASTVVTVLATLLLGGGSAFAQATSNDVRVLTPAAGDTLKARVTLEVAVDVGPIKRVDLRLTQDGQAIASGSAPTSLPCIEGCDEGGPTIWGGRTYDPALGAPFSPQAQCNGAWMLQPRVDGGAWLQGSPFTMSVPPKAPANVKITVSDDDVATITWTPDRSPDVVWHRVERSTGGGPFTILDELAGIADRYEDTTLTKGEHIYRVVAARPDGMTNGRPAVPCTDQGAELVASSKNTKLSHTDEGTVTEGPSESPSGSGSGTSGSGSGTSGSGTSGSGSSGSGSGSGTSGSEPTGNGEGSPSPEEQGAGSPSSSPSSKPTPRASRAPRPVAPPPSATRRTDTRVTAPALGNREEDDGPYYGEGEDFTTEIDYGDAEAIPGEQIVVGYDEAGEPIYETVTVPGAVIAFGVVSIDNDKVRMLAMGLLLVVLALHGRRWLNAS